MPPSCKYDLKLQSVIFFHVFSDNPLLNLWALWAFCVNMYDWLRVICIKLPNGHHKHKQRFPMSLLERSTKINSSQWKWSHAVVLFLWKIYRSCFFGGGVKGSKIGICVHVKQSEWFYLQMSHWADTKNRWAIQNDSPPRTKWYTALKWRLQFFYFFFKQKKCASNWKKKSWIGTFMQIFSQL